MDNSLAKLIRASRGPVLLMTLGGLLAIHQFTGFPFHQTFPVLIIVFGMMWLLERMAPHGATAGAAGPAVTASAPNVYTIPGTTKPYDPLYDSPPNLHREVYRSPAPEPRPAPAPTPSSAAAPAPMPAAGSGPEPVADTPTSRRPRPAEGGSETK